MTSLLVRRTSTRSGKKDREAERSLTMGQSLLPIWPPPQTYWHHIGGPFPTTPFKAGPPTCPISVQHLIISSNVGSCHTHLCRKAHFLNTYQMFNKYLLGKRDRNSNLYSHVIPGKHLRVSKRTIHSDHCESPLSSQTRKHRDIQEKYTATSHWRNFKFSSSHILKRKRK